MKELLGNEIAKFREALTSVEKVKISEMIAAALRGKDIVIYGAGAAGKAISGALAKRNIVPVFFVDRKYEEIRTADGICVYPPDQLKEVNSSHTVVIVSTDPQLFLNFRTEITELIERYCGRCGAVLYGRNLVDILLYSDCARANTRGEEFHIIDCINCGAESRGCEIFDDYLRRTAGEEREGAEYRTQCFHHSFWGYIVGQACTLKCENCCEMVPYMDSHTFVDRDTIINDCRKMAEACEFLMYIELVGGEPFLHPQLEEVLRGLLKIKNVGYIKIFTNGTVVPSDRLCEVLKDRRMIITFSNYSDVAGGRLLDHINETKEKLKACGIPYIYSYSKTWLDFKGFEPQEKEIRRLREGFKDCYISNCHRLYRGILYRCPHQYAGVQLGKLTLKEGEYVDIRGLSVTELAKALERFKNLPYIEACRYCKMPYDAREIPAGLQLDGCREERESE